MLRALCHHWRMCVTGAGLVLLAGCAGHYFAQREPWRKEAELACMKSGALKETGTLVRIEPINGPGMCGADFPFKVAALGDAPLLGYSGLRPPGEIPNAGPQRWPVTAAPRSAAPPVTASDPGDEPRYANPTRPSAVRRQPLAPTQAGTRANGAPLSILPQQLGTGGSGRAATYEPATADVRAASAGARRPSVYDPPTEPAIDDEGMPQRRGSRSP
ncbi:MAG: hypothetical protein AB7F49_33865, partial [Pseudorhodoplanes sp.]